MGNEHISLTNFKKRFPQQNTERNAMFHGNSRTFTLYKFSLKKKKKSLEFYCLTYLSPFSTDALQQEKGVIRVHICGPASYEVTLLNSF